jgi:hypothetical protein
LPYITADIARKLKPDAIKDLAYKLHKRPSLLTDKEITLWINENTDILTFQEIADEINKRFREGVINSDFSDIIFDRGNAHFQLYKRGYPGYVQSGIFWADYDDELIMISDDYILPQVVGHKEGRKIRWTQQGHIVNVNIINKDGRGRNTGVLVRGEDGVWRSIYFDNSPDEILPIRSVAVKSPSQGVSASIGLPKSAPSIIDNNSIYLSVGQAA